MIRSTRSALLLALLLPAGGCAWDDQPAKDIFHTEVARDLGGVDRDDDAALTLGERLTRAAKDDRDRKTLTLSDCFRLAIVHSEALRSRAEQVYQADTERREAIAAVLPHALFYLDHDKDSNKISFSSGSFQPSERTNYGFKIRQNLFAPQLFPRLDVIDETRRIQALTLRDERDRLLFAVASDFYELLGLQADLEAIEATRTSAKEAYRVLEARRQLGVAREDDVLLAEASEAEAEARWIQTRADLDRARARLASEVGVKPLPPLRDTYQVAPGPRDIPRLVDLALEQRYDLKAARHGVAQAEAAKNESWTDYLPTASLEFNHLTESEAGFNSQLDWTLGITFEFTLFDGGGHHARLSRAYSAIRQRQLDLSALEKRVKLEVEDAALAFRSLDRALFAFAARAKAASAAQKVTQARLAAGSATNLELLTARSTREDAVRNLVRARLGRKLAALRIRLAAGDLRSAAPVAALAGAGR